MSVINFSKANCKNCYKCVRECPVKAVKVKDEQAEIVEELCIGCGRCLKVCPKNAKEIKSELETVKYYIKEGYKVIASVAPSFAAAFQFREAGQFVNALKKLGFKYVEQTSVAADIVSKEYSKFYNKDDGKNYITTSCPAANYLIQKYHPKLISDMIPVASPMICHGRMIRKKYGHEHVKVVFIGPCLAKKMEALEGEDIDAVLTFDELLKWFNNEKINLDELESKEFDAKNSKCSIYPINGGVVNTIDKDLKKDIAKNIFTVDGTQNCMEVLSFLEKGEIKNTWIEMNLCDNGCINGPAMPENVGSVYTRKNKIEKYVLQCEKNDKSSIEESVNLNSEDTSQEFHNLSYQFVIPSEEEIKEILSSIGKNKKEDELNCGACGYNTCREKAVAVYNGMAEKNMCLPYMRQRAETLSNLIFDVTPNIIFILNRDLEIVGFNPASESLFNIKKQSIIKKPISVLTDDEDFINVKNTKQNIISKKIFLKGYNKVMLETVLYIKRHNSILVIMSDISNDEKKEKQLQKLKLNTLDMAQEVIDKQMMVAQEIASLLGETTAETKVILTKLKKIVQNEEVELNE